MKNILITGSAGFVGFHLSKRLLSDGHKVVGIDNLNSYYSQKLKKERLKDLKTFVKDKDLGESYSFLKLDLLDNK